MDHFPPGIPVWQSGLLGAWLVLGIGVYSSLERLVRTRGGKVTTAGFGLPDLLLCCGFLAWFGVAIARGFGAPEHEVTRSDILGGAAMFLSLVVLIGGFMYYRDINPFRQFGLFRRNVFVCAAMALGLFLAVLPVVMVTGKLSEYALNGRAHPQNIVQYFLSASEGSDKGAVYLTMVIGVLVAPAAEETIFRGYIYGVLKRYAGPVAAALISALLFAAMHLNASSLPALFVLALCFTLAYEASGSLLVNIFMHAFFNLSMFLVLLGISQHPVVSP